MQWKWRVLKISAILLGSIALMLFMFGSYGFGSEIKSVSTSETLVYAVFFVWWALSMLVAVVQIRSANTLLNQANVTLSNQGRPMIWMLVAALPVLAGWLLSAGFGFIEWLKLDEQERQQIPSTTIWLLLGLLIFAAMALGNYLLAISAYFEMGFRRRQAEEQLITNFGSQDGSSFL